ncbi:SpaH/EbpB family LPXTG-anchored major pilin [Enterococcus gallinarum]|uniref:SpaH/EbpB family LPXTG-anchored major pilin n=1 Tax=Enterococcus gallinarum TaxID=1353 RepID=UPI002953CE29|nr:SpaH/EbpB family LPXTG-anchored major pilin [Enterococcus gallinarum]MDV7787680.1 SpaH/EbpB family LPXTG-anchored major pilin [Enterococcus gallinarum]
MVSYVYLGIRGQAERNADGNRAGADGITFTIHNDNKSPVASESGSTTNTGENAYGALGNGLGVYGNNFSANTVLDSNNMAYMTKGVTNGIALEFDTFYNHNNTTQHSDNDLWQFVGNEGSSNSNLGHIGINYLNNLQDNKANEDFLTINKYKKFSTDTYSDTTMIKHSDMLSVGWNGNVTGLSPDNGWQVTGATQKLADDKWHRLEVSWVPTDQKKGKLTYKIYRQGYSGQARAVTTLTPTIYDGNSIIEKTLDIDVTTAFAVQDVNSTVYWGFSGSTGYYQNNQAVQMLQLPVNYYTAELSKVDQDGNPVSGARFQIEKKDENGNWIVQQFYDPETSGYVDTLETGTQDEEIGVYVGVFQSLGKIKLTQLTKGTYRWKEVAPPEGYQKNQEYYPSDTGFVVNYQNATVTTNAENKKLYQLELIKTDSDTQQPLNDVPFIISETENDKQYYLKLNTNSTGFEWTEVETDAKQFLTGMSYLLGQDGHVTEQRGDAGKITIRYFADAPNLSWKEVSVPAGYDSSGTLTGVFTPSTDNKYVYSANQTNSRLYQVSLEKKASDTNAALPGAVFSLEQQVGSEWKALGDNKTTGVDGKITISNLTAGTYRWKEVTAPDGYQILQPYFPDQNGFVVAYDSTLAIDPDTNNYIFKTTSVTNAPRDFELTLEKLSSTFQEPLQGVKFKLYDSAGGTDFSTLTPKATVTTDADGKIVLNKEQIQADNTYYLVESQTVDGFIQLKGYFTITTSKVDGINVTYVKDDTETDSSPFEFTKKDGDIYSGHLKIYNNKRKSILPTTGGNGILGYVGIGLTMTILALLFFIARKRIFKWLIILMVATSGLAGLAGGTQVVSAQEQEQVQLEVNRLVYQPSDTQYKSGVPVAGAKLEVVDVTKSFYELVNRQKLSLKEAQEAVSKSNKIDGQSLAVATTDQSGLVRFTVSKTSQQRPAVYLIRELVTPVAVTKMENMVVVLPILDESGNEKSVIPLHPKSQGTFTFDKTIDEKQSSYSFGEPISYRLSTLIPQDMTNLSSYEIEDIYDQGLRFISDSLEIFIDGEKQSDSIKAVNLSENQFRVVFDVAKLADFGGKKLEVTYQMVIKDEAAIDQNLVNTATLYPGDLTPLVDRENVQTGGFRFIKRAAEGKQNPLAKATFVIKNPTDDTILTYKDGKYQFEKVATNASGVVRLTSDDDGYFEIRGLRYGEYLVSEIRAPTGYVLQDKPTAFTVGVSTYSQGPVLSIFNVKKPKIRLPETGTVATSTAFVGLLIMASSLVMIRRRKDN